MAATMDRSPTPCPTSSAILTARHLTVRYDTRTALEDVSFQLPGGARLAVLGPNGAGKSTLLKVIAGLLKITAGEVTVHGHPPGQDVCVAFVQQRSEVDWSFPVSVSDVVMMGRVGRIGLLRRPGAADRLRVAEALEAVHLADLAGRQIGALSGGQQQRMFIARALAQEAEMVLMDEPLSGLDAPSRDEILDVLDRLRDVGVSVIMATHDLDMAGRWFEHVLLLNRRVVSFGPPAEVLAGPMLLQAYGGRVRLLDPEHPVAVDDAGFEAERGRASG
jgi:manganese/iron transport system ATP-binding protein